MPGIGHPVSNFSQQRISSVLRLLLQLGLIRPATPNPVGHNQDFRLALADPFHLGQSAQESDCCIPIECRRHERDDDVIGFGHQILRPCTAQAARAIDEDEALAAIWHLMIPFAPIERVDQRQTLRSPFQPGKGRALPVGISQEDALSLRSERGRQRRGEGRLAAAPLAVDDENPAHAALPPNLSFAQVVFSCNLAGLRNARLTD